MGLRDTIQKAAVTGVNAVGDIALVITYIEVRDEEGEYDPSTGVTTTVEVSHPDVKVVSDEYSAREVDGQVIKPKDIKYLLPKPNLPVKPSREDRLRLDTGEEWRVVNVNTDPAEALWILQSRIFDEAP